MLIEDQEEMSVSDLAEAIAAIELDKEIFELTSKERSAVYIALIQTHLTTLDETGAVAYHERSKHVYETEVTPGLADLVRHFESVCETG